VPRTLLSVPRTNSNKPRTAHKQLWERSICDLFGCPSCMSTRGGLMPRSMKNLAGLLPTVGDEHVKDAPNTSHLGAMPDNQGGVGSNSSEAKPLDCQSCGYVWKQWCAYEYPTFRNREWIPSCPKPEDVPMLNPGLEERYGQGPLNLCRDCLVRHSCTRFIGIAWCFPGCPDFKKNN